MSDKHFAEKKNYSLNVLRKRVDAFVKEREWHQFHTPKNVAMALSVEVSELLELFLWQQDDRFSIEEDKKQAVQEEAADVLIALCAFANAAGLDLSCAFDDKLEKTKQKYPVELAKGKPDKYTVYQKLKKDTSFD